jgi:hypothetical protein
MAAPNIVNVTTIIGNNSLTNVSTTSAFTIVNNAASSNKVYKVNSIIVSNKDGTNPFAATINVYDQDDLGGNAYSIISTVDVPADASVVVIDKSSSIYLREDQSIGAIANVANKLFVIASWEEIS